MDQPFNTLYNMVISQILPCCKVCVYIYIYTYIKDFKRLRFTILLGAEGDASASVDHHLEMGKKLLAAGQLTEALSHYHSAIGMKNAFLYFNNVNEIFIFLNLNYDYTCIFCTLRLTVTLF